MTRKIRKAVFPVGGLGTRFLPATKAMPKEMLPVVDKPLIQYAVEEARAAGIEEFIFVTGRGKTAIEDHFDHSYELNHTLEARDKQIDIEAIAACVLPAGQVAYTRQQEPLGLGHAIWCARHFIGQEPFAILLADDLIFASQPCLQQMISAYTDGNMVAVMEVPSSLTQRYGILDLNRAAPTTDLRLCSAQGVIEKPIPEEAPSNVAIIGRYILEPTIFNYLDKQLKGRGGEIQLTDALQPLAQQGRLQGFYFEGRRLDCGAKDEWIIAQLLFALERKDLCHSVKQLLRQEIVPKLS